LEAEIEGWEVEVRGGDSSIDVVRLVSVIMILEYCALHIAFVRFNFTLFCLFHGYVVGLGLACDMVFLILCTYD